MLAPTPQRTRHYETGRQAHAIGVHLPASLVAVPVRAQNSARACLHVPRAHAGAAPLVHRLSVADATIARCFATNVIAPNAQICRHALTHPHASAPTCCHRSRCPFTGSLAVSRAAIGFYGVATPWRRRGTRTRLDESIRHLFPCRAGECLLPQPDRPLRELPSERRQVQ